MRLLVSPLWLRIWAFADLAILSGMASSLIVPAMPLPIAVWAEIPPALILRAVVWLVGLSILPGFYLMRITSLGRRMPRACMAAISVNLSLTFVGASAIATYYGLGSVSILPYAFIAILLLMAATSRLLAREQRSDGIMLQLPHLALVAGMVVTGLISFMVFLSHLYLVPGDVWVALTPAIEILNGVDVSTVVDRLSYPVVFGFILAGFAVPMGVPIVNANALFFPLAMLNILTFYSLVKLLFKRSDGFAALAALIYAFSGGLGWLLGQLFYRNASIWTLSYITQDIYFMPFAWNAADFTYKMMAVGMVFASLSLFAASIEIEKLGSRLTAIFFASSLFLFGFLSHILPGFLAPIFVIAALFIPPIRRSLSRLTEFILTGVCLFLLVDFVMKGLNIDLLFEKTVFFSGVSNRIVAAMVVGVAALGVGSVLFYIFRKRISASLESFPHSQKIKLIALSCLAIVYLSGIFYVLTQPSPGNTYVDFSFPWYMYVTRYGLVGILALIGTATVSWKEEWFKISVLWAISAIILGSLWWGTRLNAYLHPPLALLAAYGALYLWGLPARRRLSGAKTKTLIRGLLILAITLSFSSPLYNDYRYVALEKPIPDDLVALFSWVNENTPQDSKIFIPQYTGDLGYQLGRGLTTIADRDLAIISSQNGTAETFFLLMAQQASYQDRYIVLISGYPSPKGLEFAAPEAPIFVAGNFTVYQMIKFNPPTENGSVAVLDETLDLGVKSSIGWSDDTFEVGWFESNVIAASDGDVLKLGYNFSGIDAPPGNPFGYWISPSGYVFKQTEQLDSSLYNTISVRYRVAEGTSHSIYTRYLQLVLILEGASASSQPAKYRVVLDLPNNRDFVNATFALPQDLPSLSKITLEIRSTRPANGTINLEFDYITIASEKEVLAPGVNASLKMAAVASFWPEGYSIVKDIGDACAANALLANFNKMSENYTSSAMPIKTFVFFNWTATAPAWGSGWTEVLPGVIRGSHNGKEVFIVDASLPGIWEIGVERYSLNLREALGLGK
uniref:Uncharacterized protein n=1 Tax=Candidatus Methanomethylicus mesodigestus TaxID=1867258 RepID=A0A7C3IXX3_9CREN